MPATVEILTIPIGSQLVSTINKRIDPPEPDSKNDFRVLLIFSENVTGLTETNIAVSAVDSRNRAVSGASLVSLEGRNSVWMATIRPPQTSGIVTVTVAANAVSQGNPRTSKDIRVTKFFPDADAETPTELFTFTGSVLGIAASPSRLLLASRSGSWRIDLKKYTHAGVEQTSEAKLSPQSNSLRYFRTLDYINGDILINPGGARYRETATGLTLVERFGVATDTITHTRLGYTGFKGSPQIVTQPYDPDLSATTHSIDPFASNSSNFSYSIAHQNDLIYLLKGYPFSDTFVGASLTLSEITSDDEIEVISHMNIKNRSSRGSGFIDISIYGDTLYLLSTRTTAGGSAVTPGVYTVDIRKYRPLSKNTKTTIYPVFVNEGDTIDLNQFSPDAERIVFDVGYDLQPNLSINASNKLVVGSGAQTCIVKLKAINRIGATETDSFQFYLIVRRAAAPVWRGVSELTMKAGSRYDLFQLVPDAESIAFRVGAGFPRPPGSSLSNGTFTIGTVGGVAHFTARKGSRSAHIAITIDVVQGMESESPDVSGYRIEIAGIDVTPDSVALPSVSETLDPVVINEYRVNEASITLRNNGGKYNGDLVGNFWETNGLNPGGFQNAVKIYLKHTDGTESLHFSGVINESFAPIKDATFKLNCSDISSRLRKALVQGFSTLEKWDALRKQSDEDSYAGIYVPERSLVPMQVGTGKARSDRTDLEISRLALPSEGPTPENTGYMTPTEFRTAGGFLDENPILRFLGEHQSEDVRFLMNQLAINKEVYNTEIDIPGVEVADPFLLNRGSIAFSVEQTRTTRVPVDWVYGGQGTEGRQGTGTLPNGVLILLSNPEAHISDLLVQYTLSSDSYRVLHTFEKGISVHRIERRNATNYYILTSAKISQDRSARQLPRTNDATGYAYDSLAEGSEIKIYHYNSSTGTLTALVAEDNSFPPQVSIHYHVGFENDLYIDEFEGIVPSPYSAFKVSGSNLYYRYAKDGEFGVARVNTGGTTTKLIGETHLNYHNHLNFAFDLTSSQSVYFSYCTGDSESSTLVIKRRTSGGTVTTVLSETRGVGDFNELGFDFGAFLGVHEALFHDNNLYMLVPIQKVDLGDDTRSVVNPDVHIEQRTAEKSGERNVTTSTNLNPSNRILAPGEDIPLRIDFDGSVIGCNTGRL